MTTIFVCCRENMFEFLDEEDMPFNRSRSRRFVILRCNEFVIMMYNIYLFLVHQLEKNLQLVRRVMDIVKMVVVHHVHDIVHHRDRNLVKSQNLVDHRNAVQGTFFLILNI